MSSTLVMPVDIWDAIIAQDAERVAISISQGANVNQEGSGGQTPLHLASECDAVECLTTLLKHGAELHIEDESMRSPLIVACASGSMRAARALIDAGASVRTSDENQMTPLHWFSMHGATDLIDLALRAGAEQDVLNSARQSPLAFAVTRGQLASALFLLDAKADPWICDDEKRNTLHLAMQFGGGLGNCSESMLLLLRLLQLKPDVNAKDSDRRTALHWASGKNALPCVKALISAGAEVNAVDWAQRTPIHWACLVDACEAVRALMEAGARADLADRDKRRPLHWAADRAAEGCVKILLEAGVEFDAVDWAGYTALHYAARRSANGCVQLLLGAGADHRLLAMNGELAEDLAGESATKTLLKETGGSMKRRRSLSSGNSLMLLDVLPSLAEKFYEACTRGDVSEYVTPELRSSAQQKLAQLLRKTYTLGSKHVCTRSRTIVVQLSVGARAEEMHSLTFDSDGLLMSFRGYTEAISF
uniref:Uncharacterized protein n=1 Tax=Haptolina ericina TaxID=156174 RepID=A0A7S3AU01_9EUKA